MAMNSKSTSHNQPNASNDDSSPPKKSQKTLASLGFTRKMADKGVINEPNDNNADNVMLDFTQQEEEEDDDDEEHDDKHDEGFDDADADNDNDKEEEASDLNEQCNRNDDGIVITIDESLKKREIEHLDALIKVKEEQLNELKKKLGSLCIDAKGPDVTPAFLLRFSLIYIALLPFTYKIIKSLPCLIRGQLRKRGLL